MWVVNLAIILRASHFIFAQKYKHILQVQRSCLQNNYEIGTGLIQ